MSKLLEDIQKIQSETGCSLTEAKEAYDKASCDIDLAIALVKENKSNKHHQFQERPREETGNNNSFNYYEKPKEEKPFKSNKIYEAMTKNETREEMETRMKKTSKFFKVFIVSCAILAIVFLGLYFAVSKKDVYLGLGVASIVIVILYGLLASMINRQNKTLLNLVDKYPNVETGQIKTIFMKYKGKNLDAIERELRVLSGEAGEAQKQELEKQNINAAKEFSRKVKKNNRLGPILFVVIIVVGLMIAVPIIGAAYGTDFGMGDVFSSCGQGGSPSKGYKLIKKDIKSQIEAFYGTDDVKFSNAEYVMFYDTKPLKSNATDIKHYTDNTDCTIIIKFTYSFNSGGTKTKTEYWGYNPKTNQIKEFNSYYGEESFNLAAKAVHDGEYKGKTGKL